MPQVAKKRTDNIIELPGARDGLPKEAWEYLATLGKGRKPPKTYDDLTFEQQRKVDAWKVLIKRADALQIENGFKKWKAAANLLIERIQAGLEAPNVVDSANRTGQGKRTIPSYSRLAGRRKEWKGQGDKGLFDKHTGQVTGWRDWWVPFMQLWLCPQRRKPAVIARKLRERGLGVADRTAQRFADKLPAHLGENCRWRTGDNYHRQNFTPHVVRDYSVIPVGHTWEADGHTCDFYVRHPVSGKPFRPELTWWIDWASDRIVGFRLWDRESALNTLFSLANAIHNNNHQPTVVHLDQGSGYKNKLMDGEEVTAYFQHLGITPSFALPGSPRSKGLTEGSFNIFEERVGKFFETYCGKSRTDIFMARSEIMMKRGDVYVPTWQEAIDAIEAHITERNNSPRKRLGGRTPNQVWAEDRIPNAPVLDAEELARMRVKRVVRKSRVHYDNNTFEHEKLGMHLGDEVVVEFDPLSYERGVWVRELNGKPICRAYRVVETPAAPASYLESVERHRLKRRKATGQRKIDEARQEQIDTRPHTDVTDEIHRLEIQANPLHEMNAQQVKRAAAAGERVPRADDEDDTDPGEIDIYSTDY